MRPDFPLVLLANRDEFYDRPTSAAAFWNDFPEILAGRDLVGGGTWLGVTKGGRFAAMTNFRDPSAPTGRTSRGKLVADFLRSEIPADNYMRNIAGIKQDFSGFNLLAGQINERSDELFYLSNRGGHPRKLEAGIYGLSNHLLDTPWKKVAAGKSALARILAREEFSRGPLFEILADERLADDRDLPETGIGYEREKLLSAIFIRTPVYGTRCSTVLTIDRNFKTDLVEKVFV